MDQNDTSDGCNTCFGNALAGGPLGGACAPTTDPACGHCSMQFEACLRDM
jgi:hypothetical protein